MTAASTRDEIVDALNALLAQPDLATRARQIGERLLAQLSSPIRVTLIGPQDAGKRRLCNALLGEDIIPSDGILPTCQLRHAATASVSATLGDRSTRRFDGFDFAGAAAQSPSFLEIHAPLPRLREIGVLLVVTDDWRKESLPAARWAAPKTDMVVWVTSNFDAEQKALWRAMPDPFRDHAMLALTFEQDQPVETRSDTLRRQRELARDCFVGVYPIALGDGLQASGAHHSPGSRNLVDALLQRIDLARQSDLDRALMLLERFGGEARAARPKARPHDGRATPKTDQDQGIALEGEGTPPQSAADESPSRRPDAPGPDRPSSQPSPAGFLSKSAGALLAELEGASDADVSQLVLSRCVETVDELCQIIPPDEALQDLATQAADYMLLLQLEDDDDAADEALVAMLQLKRNVEMATAC
ncbi:MAG: hypothetical protein QNJ16_17190 [Rhodobacter sp.]|nr:hypothetical protein [Rhodobacter sp.]